MKYKAFVFFLLFALMLIAQHAQAFVITPELEREIAEKRKTVQANPNDPNAHFDLGMTYAYSNFIQEGLDELKKVEALDKDFAPKAIKIYKEKVTRDPNNWKTKFRFAFALFFGGDKPGAINQLEEILQSNPNNIWAYGYMALAYGEIGNYDKSIELCKKALEMDSKVSSIRFALGQAYFKKGKNWHGFWQTAEAARLKAVGN